MLIDDYVKKLSTDLDLADFLYRTETGAYWLQLAQTHEILPQQEGFRLRTQVGQCTPDNPELISNLMLANLLGQGTGKGTLALSRNEQNIYLIRDLYWEMPYVEFKEHLETHLNYADYWKRKIAEWQS